MCISAAPRGPRGTQTQAVREDGDKHKLTCWKLTPSLMTILWWKTWPRTTRSVERQRAGRMPRGWGDGRRGGGSGGGGGRGSPRGLPKAFVRSGLVRLTCDRRCARG